MRQALQGPSEFLWSLSEQICIRVLVAQVHISQLMFAAFSSNVFALLRLQWIKYSLAVMSRPASFGGFSCAQTFARASPRDRLSVHWPSFEVLMVELHTNSSIPKRQSLNSSQLTSTNTPQRPSSRREAPLAVLPSTSSCVTLRNPVLLRFLWNWKRCV